MYSPASHKSSLSHDKAFNVNLHVKMFNVNIKQDSHLLKHASIF